MNDKLFIEWSRHRFIKNGPDQEPSTKEIWDSMSPEERACDGRLQYLAEWILLSDFDSLDESTQGYLILLLS